MRDRPVGQALYRFYAEDDALLYVGITCDIGHRWTQHAADRPWWWEVARCTVDRFPDRDSVRAAERTAILAEHPRYNIHMRQAKERGTTAVIAAAEERGDRLSAVARQELQPDSLIGSFFHSDAGRGWQGCVVGEPSPGIYLVELFSWLVGDSYAQELVPVADMVGWVFYDTVEWMRASYENGVAKRWERERAEGSAKD